MCCWTAPLKCSSYELNFLHLFWLLHRSQSQTADLDDSQSFFQAALVCSVFEGGTCDESMTLLCLSVSQERVPIRSKQQNVPKKKNSMIILWQLTEAALFCPLKNSFCDQCVPITQSDKGGVRHVRTALDVESFYCLLSVKCWPGPYSIALYCIK